MDRLAQAAVITELIGQLHEQGSWCGETHVQKASLFLQDLMHVPLGYTFVMYKHGPFSFDLRDALTAMRADGIVKLSPHPPYGPAIVPTEQSRYIQNAYPKTLAKYQDKINFVAERIGAKGVADLERLATALFIVLNSRDKHSLDERADELTRIKPHVTRQSALSALDEVVEIVRQSQSACA